RLRIRCGSMFTFDPRVEQTFRVTQDFCCDLLQLPELVEFNVETLQVFHVILLCATVRIEVTTEISYALESTDRACFLLAHYATLNCLGKKQTIRAVSEQSSICVTECLHI